MDAARYQAGVKWEPCPRADGRRPSCSCGCSRAQNCSSSHPPRRAPWGWSVGRAANGGSPQGAAWLDTVAGELAAEVLASAGYGEVDETLPARVAAVLEHVDQLCDELYVHVTAPESPRVGGE